MDKESREPADASGAESRKRSRFPKDFSRRACAACPPTCPAKSRRSRKLQRRRELAEWPVLWRVADKVSSRRKAVGIRPPPPPAVAIVAPASRAEDGTASRHANCGNHGVRPKIKPTPRNLRHFVFWRAFGARQTSAGACAHPRRPARHRSRQCAKTPIVTLCARLPPEMR